LTFARGYVIINSEQCKDCKKFYNSEDGCRPCKVSKTPLSEYNEKLNGLITNEGKVVKTLSNHVCKRVKERNFLPDDIANILENANTNYPGNSEGSRFYQLNGNRVLLGNNGNVITVIGAKEGGKHA
jgi:hypothetical protein